MYIYIREQERSSQKRVLLMFEKNILLLCTEVRIRKKKFKCTDRIYTLYTRIAVAVDEMGPARRASFTSLLRRKLAP